MVRVLPYSQYLYDSTLHGTGPTTTYIDKPPDSVPLSRQLADKDEEQLAVGSSLPKNHVLDGVSDRETDHTDGSREESVSPAPPLSLQTGGSREESVSPAPPLSLQTGGSREESVSPAPPLSGQTIPIDANETSNSNVGVGGDGSLEVAREQDSLGNALSGSNVSLEDLELVANADTTVYDTEELEQLGSVDPKTDTTKSNSNKETSTEVDSDLTSVWREADTSSESSSDNMVPRDSTISIEDRKEDGDGREESKTSSEGMTWWADAMAESETVTDNLDALVEKLEEEPVPTQDRLNPVLDEIDKQKEIEVQGNDQPDIGMSKLAVGGSENEGAKSSVCLPDGTNTSAGKKSMTQCNTLCCLYNIYIVGITKGTMLSLSFPLLFANLKVKFFEPSGWEIVCCGLLLIGG